MRRFASVLLAASLVLPLPLHAADPLVDPDAQERQLWQDLMRDARDAVDAARARHEAAELAYKRMRHHDRGRGAKKAQILAEREAAQRELEEAERRLEELPHEARRAGVPPGWLRLDDGDPAVP